MLRVVVRAGMTRDMADLLLDDLRKQTTTLERHGGLTDRGGRPVAAFRH